MHALVTGGAGFIGFHLCEYLLQHGWTVTVVDDLSTGSADNIKPFLSSSRFHFIHEDMGAEGLLSRLAANVDAVFHLAAVVGVRSIMERPIDTLRTNIRTTEELLETFAPRRIPILVASTSEVYGKTPAETFREDGDLVLGSTSKLRWSYAASKIVDELLAKAYHTQLGTPTVCVRLFNTIGPRQSGFYGMVVPRFVRQALRGEPITVHGDGSQRRSFTWVGDVVEAMVKLITTPAAYGEVFNIGHTKDISILELAELIKKIAHSTSPIVFVPYEEVYGPSFEDMPRRMPDLTKIRQVIGYAPSLDLPEMLERIIAYERARMATAV